MADTNYSNITTTEVEIPGPSVTEVRKTILEEFDERTWQVTEAALSIHATLLIKQIQDCMGLIIVGETGSGKSTVIRFFEGLGSTYRSDDATPAAFVSADASRTEGELKEIDLLPKTRNRTLTSRDMATWFSGDKDTIQERMSIMAHLMDGDGYTRDTGSHGQRGYTGNYRFNFLGASTPLAPRAWNVMGHTGNRFLFIEKRDSEDLREMIDNVFDGSDYGTKVQRCRNGVHELSKGLWRGHGGYAQVSWDTGVSAELKEIFTYLTRLVKHARAPVDESGCPHHEGGYRIANALGNVAKGHALLYRRDYIEIDDLRVCARVALSTMPNERRNLVRELVSRKPHETLTASDVEGVLEVSRPTARNRMSLMETLGIAECYETGKRNTTTLRVRPEFVWPDGLDFPAF